jgi:hypothetical protein
MSVLYGIFLEHIFTGIEQQPVIIGIIFEKFLCFVSSNIASLKLLNVSSTIHNGKHLLFFVVTKYDFQSFGDSLKR